MLTEQEELAGQTRLEAIRTGTAMQKHWIVVVIAMAQCAASACDLSQQRCKDLHGLIERLGYFDAISRMQQGCIERVQELAPDVDYAIHPVRYDGLGPKTDAWPQIRTAFEDYVEHACGPKELNYVLTEQYLEEWDKTLPGTRLKRFLDERWKGPVAKGRRGTPDLELQALKEKVRRSVQPKFDGLTGGMAQQALKEYVGQIQAISQAWRQGQPASEAPKSGLQLKGSEGTAAGSSPGRGDVPGQ